MVTGIVHCQLHLQFGLLASAEPTNSNCSEIQNKHKSHVAPDGKMCHNLAKDSKGNGERLVLILFVDML